VDGGKVIVELGPLDPVGEMLIIDGDSENLEIVASEELELYSIERDHFYHIMFHHVELSNALINMMDIRYNVNKGMAA
jgi:CRP-like cAMP-binding protein